MPKIVKLRLPPHRTVQKVAAQAPALVSHVIALTGAPAPAVVNAVRKVIHLRLGHPAVAAQAQSDLAALTSPAAQDLAGATYGALVQTPDYWVAYYTTQAEQAPLPATHPWAATIARELLQAIGGMTTAGARTHPGVDAHEAQGGIEGWGGRYLLDEQELLGEVPSPAHQRHGWQGNS